MLACVYVSAEGGVAMAIQWSGIRCVEVMVCGFVCEGWCCYFGSVLGYCLHVFMYVFMHVCLGRGQCCLATPCSGISVVGCRVEVGKVRCCYCYSLLEYCIFLRMHDVCIVGGWCCYGYSMLGYLFFHSVWGRERVLPLLCSAQPTVFPMYVCLCGVSV